MYADITFVFCEIMLICFLTNMFVYCFYLAIYLRYFLGFTNLFQQYIYIKNLKLNLYYHILARNPQMYIKLENLV